jgi:hypothetical protein
VQAEDAKFEDSWGFIIDPTVMLARGNSQRQARGRRQQKQGNLPIEPTAALKTKDSGRLGNESVNAASQVKSRGNSKVHPAGEIRLQEIRGDPEIRQLALSKA